MRGGRRGTVLAYLMTLCGYPGRYSESTHFILLFIIAYSSVDAWLKASFSDFHYISPGGGCKHEADASKIDCHLSTIHS